MRPTIRSREGNPDLSNGVQPQVNGAPANVSTDATRVSQLRLSHYDERTVVRILSATGDLPDAFRTLPTLTRSGRGRQSLSLVVPAEHARGAEGVPPARSPLALVHREVHLAGMRILEGPAAVRTALGLDQVDRLGHPLVRNGAGRAQVVETSEHVVVPIGRVGELRPGRGAMGLAVLIDHLTGRQPAKHPPLEEIVLAAEAGSSHVPDAPHRSLVLQQTLQHVDRGVERSPR